MARQDRRRSAILNAIEKQAASACLRFDSLQNHFQNEHRQALRTPKYR